MKIICILIDSVFVNVGEKCIEFVVCLLLLISPPKNTTIRTIIILSVLCGTVRSHWLHPLFHCSSLHPPLHHYPSTTSPLLSTFLLHCFTLPSSPPILPSLISHPSSMPAVVLEVVSGRSAGQDPGRTSTVFSLDKCRHCKGRRKCTTQITCVINIFVNICC